MNLKIAVFTFNTEAEIFCCSCDDKKSCGLSEGISKHIGSGCIVADFVKKFIEHIKFKNNNKLPDVIIISLQESSIINPKKGLRSDGLLFAFHDCINKESNKKYALIQDKMIGIGAEGVRGLRIGAIINNKIQASYKFLFYKPLFESSISISEGQKFGKGAMLLEMVMEKGDHQYNLHFVNIHLPFLPKKVDQGKIVRDKMLKEAIEEFNKKINNLNQNIADKYSDNFGKLLTGDLNYRVDLINKNNTNKILREIESRTVDIGELKKFDQLSNIIGKDFLVDYREGVNNMGPRFMPTCKLLKNCNNKIRKYQISKKGTSRIPSWCDRILHSNDITCLMYDNFDKGTTCKSDHIPVIGLYELESVKSLN